MCAHQEIEVGERFAFGANWSRFAADIDEERIAEAESSLKEMLSIENLIDRSFLDIGCGSGLFSLAARRLGATVHSFDYDDESVACTENLKRQHFQGDTSWTIESGSALDCDYMESLGTFDIVYCWGVLHHTGAMWLGIDNAARRVSEINGKLFIAIYNDQGWKSRLWWLLKFSYNRLPRLFRTPFLVIVMNAVRLLAFFGRIIKRGLATAIFQHPRDRQRGMSAKHDNVDWIGGFPYEFTSFDSLRIYLEARDFFLINAKRTTSWGCNELVFKRIACAE